MDNPVFISANHYSVPRIVGCFTLLKFPVTHKMDRSVLERQCAITSEGEATKGMTYEEAFIKETCRTFDER